MIIEKLNLKDIPTVVNLHRRCVSKSNSASYPKDVIEAWLEDISEDNVKNLLDDTNWVVVKEKESIVGFCQYDIGEELLYQIQIDPDYQNRGYGKALYGFVENAFKKQGKSEVLVNSTLDAEPFYEKLGFKKIRNTKFLLKKGIGVDMVSMKKEL